MLQFVSNQRDLSISRRQACDAHVHVAEAADRGHERQAAVRDARCHRIRRYTMTSDCRSRSTSRRNVSEVRTPSCSSRIRRRSVVRMCRCGSWSKVSAVSAEDVATQKQQTKERSGAGMRVILHLEMAKHAPRGDCARIPANYWLSAGNPVECRDGRRSRKDTQSWCDLFVTTKKSPSVGRSVPRPQAPRRAGG